MSQIENYNYVLHDWVCYTKNNNTFFLEKFKNLVKTFFLKYMCLGL